MTEKQLETCKKYLRSTLMTKKSGIPVEDLYQHYKDLVGECIPHAEFNYPTLKEFLTSMPDVCQIEWNRSYWMVTVVADQSTQHIEKMVSRQKIRTRSRGKRRGGGGCGVWGRFNSKLATVYKGGGRGSELRSNPGANLSRARSKPMPSFEKRRPPAPILKKTRTRTVPNRQRSSSVKVERANSETVGGKAVYGSRVQEQLKGKEHGMFSSQVELVYQKEYKESLPKDWLQVMERAGMARVVREPGTSPLVYPALFGESGQASLKGNPECNNNNTTSIPTLLLPTTPEWDITICSVSSTNEVYLWLGEANSKLTELHEAMLSHHQQYRDNTGSCPLSLNVGHVYSALVGEGKVRRVQVLNLDTVTETCTCFMIDYGKEITLCWNKMLKLNTKFHELPGQAVKVNLAGVEHHENRDQVEFVNNLVEGRRLIGLMVDNEIEGSPSLILFDTSQEEDVMVSAEIIKQVNKEKHIMVPAKNVEHVNHNNPTQPRPTPDVSTSTLPTALLPGVGESYDLVVSHILSPSMFYVQAHSSIIRYTELNAQMTMYYKNSTTMANESFTPGALFAVMQSNTWYRAKLVKTLSSSLFCMHLIDTGMMMVTNKENIKPLAIEFKKLPAQAIKAKLASVKPVVEGGGWDDEAVVWFKHVALDRNLVGLVEEKVREELVFILYDTSVKGVDIVINQEMVKLGLAFSK